MKYIYFLITSALISCQPSSKNAEILTEPIDTIVELNRLDTLIEELNSDQDIEVVFNQADSSTERILVDKVHYFESTKEIYVSVGFKEGYDWKALDTLKTYADSIVFQDIETTRTRYPFDKANEYLDLELLDGIVIFNYSHISQGTSRLKRIEYFEDVLGDQFIAILETPEKLKGNKFYGINGTNEFTPSFTSHVINDTKQEESVRNYVKLKVKYDWKYGAVMVEPYNLRYVFYSFLSESNVEKSFLFEIDPEGIKIMAEITNDYKIRELCPVAIQVNKKPVLLLWVDVPETDIEWFTPAVFDGQKFKITNRRIIDVLK